MVKIDKHIRDLLQDNECVIVPDMGGFLNAQPFTCIRPIQNSSKLVSDKLSFNVFLNYNDGLLANHIVQQEKLTYNEALKEIEKFTFKFHQELESGNKFIIDQVCVLYKDEESNIHIEPFESRDYLNVSEVISDLQSFSDLPDESNRKTEKQPEKSVISPPSKLHPGKSITFNKSTVIFFVLLLNVSILSYYLVVYFSRPSKLNSSSFNSHTILATEQPVIENALKANRLIASTGTIKEIVAGGSQNTVKEKDAILSNSSAALVSTSTNISANKYFIVAGSFRSFDNAKRKLDELKLHGFKNAQIFSDSRHLLVCYDHFNTLEEAHEKMNYFNNQNKEAWIYSY